MKVLLRLVLVKPVDDATAGPALDETCHVDCTSNHERFDCSVDCVHDAAKGILNLAVHGVGVSITSVRAHGKRNR